MTNVSVGFRPPCWCPSRWAPTWRFHTNLYKFGENVSPHIFHKKNSCDLNLGEGLCISTFFLFPDSGLNLLNGFDFLFWSILNGVTLKTTIFSVYYRNTSQTSIFNFCREDQITLISMVVCNYYVAVCETSSSGTIESSLRGVEVKNGMYTSWFMLVIWWGIVGFVLKMSNMLRTTSCQWHWCYNNTCLLQTYSLEECEFMQDLPRWWRRRLAGLRPILSC